MLLHFPNARAGSDRGDTDVSYGRRHRNDWSLHWAHSHHSLDIVICFSKNSTKPPEPNSRTDKQSHKLVFVALPILLAVVLALVVSVPLSKSPVVSDEGLVMNPTEAGDLNFHLSIIARFVESPHVPPEDPYLPSHYVVYDFSCTSMWGH